MWPRVACAFKASAGSFPRRWYSTPSKQLPLGLPPGHKPNERLCGGTTLIKIGRPQHSRMIAIVSSDVNRSIR